MAYPSHFLKRNLSMFFVKKVHFLFFWASHNKTRRRSPAALPQWSCAGCLLPNTLPVLPVSTPAWFLPPTAHRHLEWRSPSIDTPPGTRGGISGALTWVSHWIPPGVCSPWLVVSAVRTTEWSTPIAKPQENTSTSLFFWHLYWPAEHVLHGRVKLWMIRLKIQNS